MLKKIDPYLVVLIITELFIYSLSFDGYFFGDSVAQLYTRPKSLSEALGLFTRINVWYRPFSQEFIAYILFPALKTNFVLYHALNLILHVIVSAVLYLGLVRVFKDNMPAFAGSFFFGIHAVNFYTTYDNAFFLILI